MFNKFKQKICWVLCCQLTLIFIPYAIPEAYSYEYEEPEIQHYKSFIISAVFRNQESRDSFKTKAWSKIIIQQSTQKPNLITSSREVIAPAISQFGQPIWEITVEQLPLSEHECNIVDADTCDDNSSDCYKPCFSSSPEFLAFDEKREKLYLAVASTNTGAIGGRGTYFIFVGDISKKEIKFSHKTFGPLNGGLSPSGKYLITYGYNVGEIYNTLTGEEFEIGEDNIYDPPEKVQLHYLGHIKWLSDTQFTYQDIVAHDKFQHEPDGITEHTVDIPMKKTVYSKTIKANTYQYKPGDELKN